MRYLYKVAGYDKKVNGLSGDRLDGAISVAILAKNEKEAIAFSKKIIKKPHYQVISVEEENVNGDANNDRRHHEYLEKLDALQTSHKRWAEGLHKDYLRLAKESNQILTRLVDATKKK